ncbi:MAG: MBOAT family protein [Bacteroidetes bacterium]|nr:MBOAT family protein [Bacteroidota bacterium]
MLFNSLSYFLFLPAVFLLYWLVFNRSVSTRNLFLIVVSYFFYACWDWRFLFLLVFSTLLDYFSGLKIEACTTSFSRRMWLWISIGINLGLLLTFKYFNFFIDSFNSLLSQLRLPVSHWSLKVILPVGISFYTFHGLSYVIDIYYRRIRAERNFVTYSLFVSFFPLLVAGPIERATHLLPQLREPRKFNYEMSVDGLRQILWGLLKKVVIADKCAEFADPIFNNFTGYGGSTLFAGAVLFSVQIYCDFSGYTDIATGSAKLLGFNLLRNFNYPYFSRSIAEFWRRWHISLSSWFRDYVYIPLGGSKGGKFRTVRNTFVIFLLSGFWHGANWTFIFWGLLNALYILPSVFGGSNRQYLDIIAADKRYPTAKEALLVVRTFLLILIAWVFFRSETLSQAFSIVGRMFSRSFFEAPLLPNKAILLLACIPLFFLVEWLGRRDEYAIQRLSLNWSTYWRWTLYLFFSSLVIYFLGSKNSFIYFQF